MDAITDILFAAAVLLIDFFPKRKEEGKKANILYLVLLSIGLCVLVLRNLGVKIPSPAEPIKMLVEAIFGPQN
ncbi:MAG TPA: hypothetical protein VN608_03030 [Clostridia bacterium]|nr:hypothetical protein [Clostridia bacterium]